MITNENVIITIAAFLSFFVYNLVAFSFTTKILEKASKQYWIHAVLGIINTLALSIYFISGLSHNYFYILSFVVFLIEFRLISKSKFVQVLFGASVFAVHIALLHMLIIVGFSWYFEISPAEVSQNTNFRLLSTLLLSVFLFLALTAVKNILPLVNIKRTSSAKFYSLIVSAFALFVILFFTLVSVLLLGEGYYPQEYYLVLGIIVFTTLLFYFNFFYIINFTNMMLYKRQSDEAENQYQELLDRKSKILTKVETDGLTGLYNRKYIYDLMKTLISDINTEFGIIFIDVNALKYVNDNFGHESGDKLLVVVSNAITSTLREQDFSARVGGDEFLIVLSNVRQEDLKNIISRIKSRIREFGLHEVFPVYASMGAIYVDAKLKKIGLENIITKVDENMRIDKEKFYSQGGIPK